MIASIVHVGVTLVANSSSGGDAGWIGLVFFTSGFAYYGYVVRRYRNADARHRYEDETAAHMANGQADDHFVASRTGLPNERMLGANDTDVSGTGAMGRVLGNLTLSGTVGEAAAEPHGRRRRDRNRRDGHGRRGAPRGTNR